MRSKTLGINVRVTEEEKEKLRQNAKSKGRQQAVGLQYRNICADWGLEKM